MAHPARVPVAIVGGVLGEWLGLRAVFFLRFVVVLVVAWLSHTYVLAGVGIDVSPKDSAQGPSYTAIAWNMRTDLLTVGGFCL